MITTTANLSLSIRCISSSHPYSFILLSARISASIQSQPLLYYLMSNVLCNTNLCGKAQFDPSCSSDYALKYLLC